MGSLSRIFDRIFFGGGRSDEVSRDDRHGDKCENGVRDEGGPLVMSHTERRRWTMPELVVLARSGPEESVLASCKATALGGGPDVNDQGCGWTGASCAACQPRSGGAS
jgi:hypothetical protein